VIEQARDVLIWGRMSDFIGLTKYLVISLVCLWAGFAFFQIARKGFADVF
jgi:lipopolysaccharide transport system permease protein